jgi:hypothetical protein
MTLSALAATAKSVVSVIGASLHGRMRATFAHVRQASMSCQVMENRPNVALKQQIQ